MRRLSVSDLRLITMCVCVLRMAADHLHLFVVTLSAYMFDISAHWRGPAIILYWRLCGTRAWTRRTRHTTNIVILCTAIVSEAPRRHVYNKNHKHTHTHMWCAHMRARSPPKRTRGCRVCRAMRECVGLVRLAVGCGHNIVYK